MPTFCHNTGGSRGFFVLLVFDLSSKALPLFDVFEDDDVFVSDANVPKPISYGFSARMRRLCLCDFVEIAAISLPAVRYPKGRDATGPTCNAAYRPETKTEHLGHRHPPFSFANDTSFGPCSQERVVSTSCGYPSK